MKLNESIILTALVAASIIAVIVISVVRFNHNGYVDQKLIVQYTP